VLNSRSLHLMIVASLSLAVMGVGCRQSTPEADTDPATETPAESESAIAPTESATPPETEEADPEPAPTAEESDDSALTDVAAAAAQSCSASAFVIDSDPAGLNVRSGPSSEFAVIDTLPTDGPVEVTIAGADNGWLQLTVAWSMEQQELESPGWVYAPLLGVTTRNPDASSPNTPVPLHSEPDHTASVQAEVPPLAEVSLLGCAGDWLQVQSETASGWLAASNQCSSPVTTCP